jgi:hypothetical protein
MTPTRIRIDSFLPVFSRHQEDKICNDDSSAYTRSADRRGYELLPGRLPRGRTDDPMILIAFGRFGRRHLSLIL